MGIRHKDDPEDKHEEKPASKSSAQTPKKKWAAFVDDRVGKYSDDLEEEPEKSINQTDSTKKYKLSTKELATLSYFGKPNPKYGNTTKCELLNYPYSSERGALGSERVLTVW